jgi:hypothetical protein
MLLAAAIALAAATPHPVGASAGASAQAMATIRIISGVRLSFRSGQNDASVPLPRTTTIRTSDSQEQPARLIEFQ